MTRYLCIHGHFYQPPRENPWLEEIEVQDSAYPYHDWNQRIAAECYSPNAVSRIFDPDHRIVSIANNYSNISFDFGPTLLSWLEKYQPETYQSILEADRLSRERFSGHGSAMAQAYNHMILPLANKRDKYTQVFWGIKDFEARFGRQPEGMWLPETAVDLETLEVLAEQGIKFTVLAPRQAKRVRKMAKGGRWQDVSGGKIDPAASYVCMLPSRKTIHLFFYDGPISHDMAFGDLLNSGEAFAGRLLSAYNDQRDWPQIVHIATDGETYGHHHRFADMALAYCVHFIQSQGLATLTNYGEYLENHRPMFTVEIFEGSSWSCIHGIERWREDCGCNSGMHQGWNQRWRRPLREALDGLRDRLAILFEEEGSRFLDDPWEARNDYISIILDRSPESRSRFWEKHALDALSQAEGVACLKLLEMQRNAMLMYTSCAWFFDEISGIETTQTLKYAARAIQLAEEVTGKSFSDDFLPALEKAPTNIADFGNGKKIYEMFVNPAMVDFEKVGGHWAISSLFEDYPEKTRIFCYTVQREVYDRAEAGKINLATGRIQVTSEITQDEHPISFAVLHLGDHILNGGVKQEMKEGSFRAMESEVRDAFSRSDIPDIIRLMDKHLGANNYSLWNLFRDEQRKIIGEVLRPTLDGIASTFRETYEKSHAIMNFLQGTGMPLPKRLQLIAEYVINADLKTLFLEKELDGERIGSLVKEASKWSLEVDKTTLGFAARSRINGLMENLKQAPEKIETIEDVIKMLESVAYLSVELDLWKAQNLFFSLDQKVCPSLKEKAELGDQDAKRWVDLFHRLGLLLNVKPHD